MSLDGDNLVLNINILEGRQNRLKVEKIKFNNHEIFNDLEIEHMILEKMTKYMQLVSENDFYLSDEIDLFEGIIKLFIDSNIARQLS